MPTSADVSIEGLRELETALQKLNQSVADVMKYAVSEASKPILDDARRRIHSIDHDLERSLAVKQRLGKAGLWEGTRIGPQYPLGAHGHLVEFGHRNVKGGELGKGGVVVGNVPAHPFMRPAVKARRSASVTRIEEILSAAIKEVVD